MRAGFGADQNELWTIKKMDLGKVSARIRMKQECYETVSHKRQNNKKTGS